MLMWRGEVTRPPAQQSIKHMQAWRLKTNVSVDALEEEADALAASPFSIGHIAIGVALGYIDFRFPELDLAQRPSDACAWYETFEARPSVQGDRRRSTSHDPSPRDRRCASITGVIEYSGPTHAPEFLYPAVDEGRARRGAEGQRELARAASLRAEHRPADRHDPALGACRPAATSSSIDTGVGNRKPRAAAARMDQLNTLVMPWLEADRRRAGAGHACGDDASAHRSCRLEHGREGRQMGADVSEGALSHPARPSSTTGRREYDKGDKAVNQGSFADSVLPIIDAGLADFMDGTSEVAGCLTPEPVPGHAPGMLSFRLRSRGEEGLFCADILHNAIQIVRPDWNDRYVLWPDKALESRAAVPQARVRARRAADADASGRALLRLCAPAGRRVTHSSRRHDRNRSQQPEGASRARRGRARR